MAIFDVYPDRSGKYRWRLYANNWQIIADSEAFASKQNAIKSAELVKALAGSANIVVRQH